MGVFAEVKGRLTGLNEFVTGSITQTSALMCETIVSAAAASAQHAADAALHRPHPCCPLLCQVERLVEELQPFAVNPLADPTQPLLPAALSPPHHAWLSSPQLLSHTLQSAPVYLDAPPSASPLLLALPLSCFTHLLVTAADHISPPSLAEAMSSSAGLPVLRLNAFTLPFSPLVLSGSIRCVGYRFIERLLPLGREVEAVGRVQMTAEGALRMVEGSGQDGEKVMLLPLGDGAEGAAAAGGRAEAAGREMERSSRESEYGLELIATVSGVVGCVSLCWWWLRTARRTVSR